MTQRNSGSISTKKPFRRRRPARPDLAQRDVEAAAGDVETREVNGEQQAVFRKRLDAFEQRFGAFSADSGGAGE